MKENKTKADVIFVYAAYSLRYIYLLFLIPFYARVLGPEGYGVVLAALSLMQIIWLFVNWGFSIDGLREIATTETQHYKDVLNKHLSGRLVLSFIALAAGFIAIHFSAVLSIHWLTGFLAVVLGIISAFNLGWYFTGTHRPRMGVKLEVIGFILNLAFILTFVRDENDYVMAIGSVLASGTISLMLAYWWIKNESRPMQVNLRQGVAFVNQTKSSFVYSSSAMLLGASSTYLLSTLSTIEQVGFFGSAERLVSAGLSVMAPIGAIFIPKVTVLLKSDTGLAYRYIRKIMLGLFLVGFTGLLFTEFAATFIVNLLFGHEFAGSVDILRTLAIIFPFYACSLVLSAYVLIPLHKENILAKITIFSAIVNIAIAIPLAAHFGGIGMAYARVVSECVLFFTLFATCYKLGLLKNILPMLFHKGSEA